MSSLDSIALLRGELEDLRDAADAAKDVRGHAILDRGRLVGRWDFDPDTASIVWTSFVPRDKALERAVAGMETFAREDLGDVRSFSLDNPKSRVPRIQALRAAAGK